MRLSVLDQSPTRAGVEPAAAIRESVRLAERCEQLGFERYWVSEHHNAPSIAGSAPEVLLGAIAARTSRIRIGAAGIMLPHYASLKVAETFRVLEAIAPGRVDLGLGRAPGTDTLTARALNPRVGEQAEQFPRQVQEVQALVEGQALATPYGVGGISAEPRGHTSPALWILGSSTGGAQIAAYLGLPYCFAWFFSDGAGAEDAIALYRARFRPSATLAAPHVAIAVFAIAAPTRDEAEFEHLSRERWRLDLERGRFLPLVPPADARMDGLAPAEEARVAAMRARAVLGTGPDVVEAIGRVADGVGADEVAVVTACFDPAIRERSYALIAAAAGLGASSPA